ncbi:MAG: hypothetical protein WC521_04065 [Bdellovibrionales bacterium]
MRTNFFTDNNISNEEADEAIRNRHTLEDPAATLSALYWMNLSTPTVELPLTPATGRKPETTRTATNQSALGASSFPAPTVA